MRTATWSRGLKAIGLLGLSALLSACHGGSSLSAGALGPESSAIAAWAGSYDRPPDLIVAHVNDVHSHLDASALTLTAGAGGERIKLEVGGMPRIARVVQSLRQQAPDRVLALHAGDAITGDLYFNLFRGEADAALMQAVCFDAFALGNHEFDHGDAALSTFLAALEQGACAPAILSANVQFGPNSPLAAWQKQGRIAPAVVVRRGGERVGVVGLTVADKTLRSSRPDPGTVLQDELTSAQAAIDELRSQGVERIIVLSHIGYQADLDLASRLRGVDVVVGGDSHSLLAPEAIRQVGLSPVGPYPSRVQNAEGESVCVVQAAQHALVLGRLAVWFDKQGRVESCQGLPLIPLAETPSNAGWPQTTPFNVLFEAVEPLESAVEVLAPYAQARADFGQNVVAQVPADWCMQRLPLIPGFPRADGQSSSGACQASPYAARHGGEVAQWVVHALAQAAQPYLAADFLLLNAGSIRHDLPAGNLKVADLYSLLPFDNTLLLLTLKGSEVKQLLEAQFTQLLEGQSSGRYLVGSGIRWWYSSAAPLGQRVQRVEVRQKDGSYRPLQSEAFYRVATTDFVAGGGDGYDVLKRVPAERRVDVGLPQVPLLLEWLAAQNQAQNQAQAAGPVLSLPPVEEFSTQAIVGQ